MRIEDIRECFYQPGKPGAIDMRHPVTGLGIYSGETLEQIRARYPGAQVGDVDRVSRESEDAFRRDPVEIPRERFHEMLNVLPPVGWERGDSAEVFKMSERTYGNVTTIYCRLGNRFFEMSDDIRTDAGMVIARCEKARKRADALRFDEEKWKRDGRQRTAGGFGVEAGRRCHLAMDPQNGATVLVIDGPEEA